MSRAEGHNGSVEFDGTFITLRPPKGFLGSLKAKGAGERRFPAKSITMVEFVDATRLKNGYIRFLTAGMSPLRGTPTRPAFMDALSDPNAIVFKGKHSEAFSQLRNEIDLAIAG